MSRSKMGKSDFKIKKFFALKYLELVKKIPPILNFSNREFAYLLWDKNYMIRHQGYNKLQDFQKYTKNAAPRHVYLSAAVYKDPFIKNMTDKGWFGCDFIVDIDSDHFDLDCQYQHDFHICQDPDHQNCHYFKNGRPPQECPECGGKKFKKQLWICDNCLDASKNEIIKLIDNFLIPDFGFSIDQMKIVFSGHRGYHIHISNESIRKLKSDERRQIVDFVTGTGFSSSDSFKLDVGGYYGSKTTDIGWKGKIARKMYDMLTNLNQDAIERKFLAGGINKNQIKIFTNDLNIAELLNYLEDKNKIWNIKGVGLNSWKKIISVLINEIKCDIDVPVSIDIHRLIRLTGSIHGKTGFLVQPIEYDQLNDFDPFSTPVIFSLEEKGSVSIKITTKFCPKFRIKDEIYGPFDEGEKIKLPEAVSLFLICKGVASFDT